MLRTLALNRLDITSYMAAAGINAKKAQATGNIDHMLTIFDLLTQKDTLSKLWDIHEALLAIVGPGKLSKENFDKGMYKLLYKLLKSSCLAITQQTLSTIAKIKQEYVDEELDRQSTEIVKFKNQFMMDSGIRNIRNIIDLAFQKKQYEVYFFCVSSLQPLIFN